MALSNWATLAVDINGPQGGLATNHLDVSIEIYKNWLYIRDPQAWQEGRGFMEPVIMQIESGTISYGGWRINAARGPQNGVFVVASSARYESVEKGTPFHEAYQDKRLLVGCGVYGYDSYENLYALELQELGIDPNDPDISCYHTLGEDEYIEFVRFVPGEGIVPLARFTEPKEVGWLGVNRESLDFLKTHLHNCTDEHKERSWPDSWLDEINLDAALVANQGDMFFASALGEDPIGTPVGEQPPRPIIEHMIGGADG